jgi:YD repeat-containing protein
VQQVKYDAVGRVDCTATRMNPATFGSLPTACDRATAGSFGPDRIMKYGYDNGDRVTSVTTGYGQVSEAITEQSMTYLPGGRLQTLADGKGNKTTYSYDSYGRTYRVYYPDPNTVGTSSSTDYEEFAYNLNSQITSVRRRSGDVIQTPRDALG